MRHIVGIGLVPNGVLVPIKVDGDGILNSEAAGTSDLAARPHVLLFGTTAGGDLVPLKVNLEGKVSTA